MEIKYKFKHRIGMYVYIVMYHANGLLYRRRCRIMACSVKIYDCAGTPWYYESYELNHDRNRMYGAAACWRDKAALDQHIADINKEKSKFIRG